MQKYTNTVFRPGGIPVAGASVAVKTPAGALAAIYSDDGVKPKPNPTTTDALGEFSFFAEDGDYLVSISGAGTVPKTLTVTLEDPIDGKFARGLSAMQTIPAAGSALTIDFAKCARLVKIVLDQPVCAITFENLAVDEGYVREVMLFFVQGTGANQVTFDPAQVTMANGPLTLSIAPGKRDRVYLELTGGSSKVLMLQAQTDIAA